MSEKELCARDLSILNLIFDQSECEKEVKDFVQPIIDETDVTDDDEEDTDENIQSRTLELEGVKLTEEGKLNEALEKFNKSIKIAHTRPSPYNNRAQLYRFLEKDDREFESFDDKFRSI
jgi:hypothetical protein